MPTCDDVNCGDGYRCLKGMCDPIVLPPDDEKAECADNSDCGLHEHCIEGKCKRSDTC